MILRKNSSPLFNRGGSMEIKITQTKDGRYFAQYINPKDIMVNGIGQFGMTAFESEINLQALLNTVRCKQNKTVVNLSV
jgi:hypothetical protein